MLNLAYIILDGLYILEKKQEGMTESAGEVKDSSHPGPLAWEHRLKLCPSSLQRGLCFCDNVSGGGSRERGRHSEMLWKHQGIVMTCAPGFMS